MAITGKDNLTVVLFNQFFAPDEAPTGVLLGDVVRMLKLTENAVTVICSRTAYSSAADETDKSAEVIRVRTLGFERGACLGKAKSYATYSIAAFLRGIRLPQHDAVICLNTPPLLALVGCAIKFLRGSRLVI